MGPSLGSPVEFYFTEEAVFGDISFKEAPMGKSILLTLITLIFVFSTLFSNTLVAQEKTITVVFPTWEPYGYMVDNKASGFEIETFQAVMDKMDIRVKFEHQPWKRCLHSVKNGLADVVISALKVKERMQYLYYPEEPISISRTALFTQKDREISYNGSLDALKRYTIGVTSGFSYGTAFDESHFLQTDASTETEAVVAKVLLGRNELGVGNIAVIKTIAAKQNASGKIRFLLPLLHSQKLYAGFSKAKNHAAFAKAFSIALADFRKSADYKRIMEKYKMD